ncbi:sporulation protein YtxC [Alteribacillus iranensis]|uniref:sporulation protein YtxC n=1 Tax=Alteribacillus iranensis TaxID=930128 RepID=UPI0015A54243|nr:sporulation protein YtxC [Alteribacillus iranensis]
MFSIGFECETDSEAVFQWFSNEKQEWEQKGIRTGCLYINRKKIWWDFSGTETEWQESMLPYLASSLCDYLIQKHELKWVKRYIEHAFLYKEESPAITDIAHSLLEGERLEIPEANLLQKRKHFVYRELLEEIKDRSEIAWAPLLTFRFGNYHHLLMKAAAAAIDEYKWEQEYQTMVEECRHYLKHHLPVYSMIHVQLTDKPVFLNEKKEPIDQWTRLHYLKPALVFEKSLPFEYMVVSPLVSFAPDLLHVYTDMEEGTVETLRMIFQENVIVHPMKEWPLPS